MKIPFLKNRPAVPAVAKAEAILEKYRKLGISIAAGVADMGGLIAKREAAEAALGVTEVDVATGAGSMAAVTDARKKVDEACGAIEDAGRRLTAIRNAQNACGVELAEVRADLAKQVPAYTKAMVAELTDQWNEAVATFSRLRGRKAAIERLTRTKLNLHEPTVPAIQIDEEPYRITDKVVGALDTIAAKGRRRLRQTSSAVAVDSRVYVMRKSLNGMLAGQRLTRWTFGDQELQELIELGVAIPVDDARQQEGVLAAMRAQDAMEDAHKADVAAEDAARAAAYRQEQAEAQRKALKREFYGMSDDAIAKELRRRGRIVESDYLTAPPQNSLEHALNSGFGL